jgi:hypothetical protein
VHHESVLGQLRDDKAKFEEGQRVRFIDLTESIETLTKALHEKETFGYQIAKDHIDHM